MFAASILYITSLARIIYWYLYADRNQLELMDQWSTILADSIHALAWLIIILFSIYNHRNRIVSSGSLFIYFLLESLVNIYLAINILMDLFNDNNNQELWMINYDSSMIIMKLIYIASILYIFYLECYSNQDSMKRKFGTKSLKSKLINPECSASFFSRITFSWFTKLVKRQWRQKSLQQENMWLLSLENTSNLLMQSFRQSYNGYREKNKQFNMMSILIRLYLPELLWIALLKLIACVFLFINPIMLNRIITFLKPTNTEPYWRGFVYAFIMFISPMFESLFTNQHEYQINMITMRMKTCITAIVYQKSLRLSPTAKQKFSTGEIVNLISVDTLRIVDLINNINTLWWAPLQICIGLYLVWLQLSYASLAGFSYMLLIVPVNIMLTNLIRSYQLRLMTRKDSRSKLMNEILNGIKVIKLNAWERHFETKINHLRSLEMKQLKYIAYCNTFMTTFFSSGSIFVALFSFMAYTLMSDDNVLDANRAFVSLSLFNIIRVPLTFLPLFFSFAAIALVSLKRLNEFINAPELSDYSETIIHSNKQSFESKNNENDDDDNDKQQQQIAIRISNGNFNWIENDPIPTIHDINLTIRKHQLIGIVGGVGSGKSSLLSACLGEMEKLNDGRVEIDGRIAYVPQEAWILNATIRDNILLNKKYDEKKYKKVLDTCALQLDMAMFAAGDLTEVGEKGINLSGGQKQRISLARAVYSNSDIYLLDNPLSALDAHVSQHIFENVIGPNGCLRNKTRILVTTKLSLLPKMNEIIYISRGEIKDQGRFEQLIENDGPFSKYVAEYFLDQQNGIVTDLDQPDSEFINQIEPKIKQAIEHVQLSRSISYNRNISMNEQQQRLQHSTFTNQSNIDYNQSQRLQQQTESTMFESGEINFIETSTRQINDGRLIQTEEMAEGSVKLINHKIFLKTIGWYICLSVMLTLLLSNLFQIMSSLWLTDWSNDSLRPSNELTNNLRWERIIVFAVLGIIEVFFTFLGTLQTSLGCVRASRILHNKMITHIIRAPMSFFDTTPLGRILNRFTKDIDVVDLRISSNIRLFIMQIYRTIVAFGLIGLEAPIILAFFLPLTIGYYILQKLFIQTSRQLKRIEAVSRSPLNNHLSETVNGITSIRAYGLTKKFQRIMLKRIDDNNQSYWLGFTAARWLAIRLEFISYSIVFLATLFAILSRGTLSPGVAGLAISYSLNITAILNLLIRGYSEIETNFVSVERIVEYISTPEEKQLISNELERLPFDWPEKGEISFENYSTQYRSGLKLCLKRINLLIPGGSKVAIVGRTGSGKSSFALALFRVLEPIEGTIYIDNIDIRKVTLETLRKSLTIVPQDPIIFTATLRENVDTLSRFNDEQCIQALKDAKMNEFLENINYNLDYMLTSNDNLSVGQRQLICLARALLKRSSIIVFDEATASVDHETDGHIHDTIFSETFQTKTVFMIAHRLDYIMNYDYILVMDNGEMIEFDNPNRLIKNIDGQFYSLAKEAKII
uniref:ABC-type glutathione-S-conjugate transporter n=1 Tax=Dermatophagoides pteronyssinus TaxID=6956 RepID=A0A6P6YDM6_DERPT|nr:canalicular multispecific organic anion transporter 2-like [Dermatophagoides pteronyssinus]